MATAIETYALPGGGIGFDDPRPPGTQFASPGGGGQTQSFGSSVFGQPSTGLSFNQRKALISAGGRASASPPPLIPLTPAAARGPSQIGTKTTEFGRADFDAALIDWDRVYNDAQQGIPAALELIEQFAPGGSFGAGRRAEATEFVQAGVAKDTASAVASGMSSLTSSRGLNVLAGSELSKQFANIDDMRAQLQIQAFSPYTQMLSNLAAVGTARPTTAPFIDRITTPVLDRGVGDLAVGAVPRAVPAAVTQSFDGGSRKVLGGFGAKR